MDKLIWTITDSIFLEGIFLIDEAYISSTSFLFFIFLVTSKMLNLTSSDKKRENDTTAYTEVPITIQPHLTSLC